MSSNNRVCSSLHVHLRLYLETKVVEIEITFMFHCCIESLLMGNGLKNDRATSYPYFSIGHHHLIGFFGNDRGMRIQIRIGMVVHVGNDFCENRGEKSSI